MEEVKATAEEVKEDIRHIKVTKEVGLREARVVGRREEEVTKDIKEEVKEDTETQRDSREEVKEDIKEEVKGDTRAGTQPEVTKRPRAAVKGASSHAVSGTATGAAVKGISPRTAQAALTRSGQAQGGQPG